MSTEEKIAKLREARALITEPEHWWRGRNYDKRADQLCASLAVSATFKKRNFAGLDDLLNELRVLAGPLVTSYNDSHTHAEVLQLFDDTIARLEGQLQGASA